MILEDKSRLCHYYPSRKVNKRSFNKPSFNMKLRYIADAVRSFYRYNTRTYHPENELCTHSRNKERKCVHAELKHD
jgi:hypothetical protein